MPANRAQLPAVGPDPSFRFPDIVRHTLPNGLRVRTVEHHNAPVVTCVLQIDGGFGADPADRHGLAALTADMLDEGTGSLSAIDVSDALARIGADYDLDVGPDAVSISITTVSRFAERGAALLADLVVRPALRDADFTRVRKLRLDRLAQLRDLPPAVAERAFTRMLYGDHPYGHLAIGDTNALRAVTLEEVAAFHARMADPRRALVVLAGAMSHEDLLALAEGAFGGWAPSDAEPLPSAAPVDVSGAAAVRLAIVPREAAAQSELRIGHLAASRSTPDYPALLVMNAVLGGQFVSRINLKLREEKGYTYGARTGFDWRRGIAPFSLHASVHTASTVDAVQDALGELAAIRDTRPPDANELGLAKASLTRGYPRNFETAQQVARSVSQLALYDLPDTYFERFVPTVNAIQAADVVRVANQYLDPSRMTTLIVGDFAVVGSRLEALGLGPPQVLPPDA